MAALAFRRRGMALAAKVSSLFTAARRFVTTCVMQDHCLLLHTRPRVAMRGETHLLCGSPATAPHETALPCRSRKCFFKTPWRLLWMNQTIPRARPRLSKRCTSSCSSSEKYVRACCPSQQARLRVSHKWLRESPLQPRRFRFIPRRCKPAVSGCRAPAARKAE